MPQAHASVQPAESRKPVASAQPAFRRSPGLTGTFSDNRPQARTQRELSAAIDGSPRVVAQRAFSESVRTSPYVAAQRKRIEGLFGPPVQLAGSATQPRDTGLPPALKSGVESLSGVSLDNVRVHYNSSRPAQFNALAYAQGADIHVAPGQERHLPHEAWHVVQQARGRVQPTMRMDGGVPVNDDAGLEREADLMGAKALSPAAQLRSDPAAAAPVPSGRVVQRTATPGATVYFNGDKVLYTLTGQDGHFVKAALQPRAGFTKYKKVVATGETAQNGKPKYKLADPPVEVEEDDRTPKQKWVDKVGGGSFGDEYFVLPGGAYPHLSVSYALDGETITFGDAHYSRSHDDSRRLTYTRTADGWAYQADTPGLNHVQVKQTADALIQRMQTALA